MPLSKDTVTNMIQDAINDEETVRIISTSVMDSVNSALAVRDLRITELESKVSDLQSANKTLDESVNNLRFDIALVNIHIEQLKRVSDDNSQYSRKLNLILDGLRISKSDNDKKIRQIVLKEIHRLDLDIDDYEVDRAHRTGKAHRDGSGKWHIPIIVRFTSWFARNTFYEARKSSNAYVKADLTNRRQDLLNDARKLWSVEGSRAAKLFQFVFVDRNCHLSVRTNDGRIFKFNSLDEFYSLMNYVEDTSPPDLSAWKFLEAGMIKLVEPAIVNLHTITNIEEWLKDEDHVYVGRSKGEIAGSPWGNPFKLEEYDIQTSLRLYEDHVTPDPNLSSDLGSLKKKSLGCWCLDPGQCHAILL